MPQIREQIAMVHLPPSKTLKYLFHVRKTKARQPPSFPGFLFAAESLVQINKMYIPDAHGLL